MLIVEDDPSIAIFIVMCVEELGYAAVCCGDGEQGLHLLEVNPKFDLLITDITMPKMDGEQLVRLIQSREKFTHLPIIIISGVVNILDISKLLDKGETHFLSKPVAKDHLQDCVTKLIQLGMG